jgi:hypothetical protein
MLNTAARKSQQKKALESHQAWIQAFDTEGPFISVPVAKKTWGDVVPRFSAEAHEGFRLRFADFVKAYDALDLARLGALSGLSTAADHLESQQGLFRDIQTEWVSFVLRDLAKWGDRLDTFTAPLPEYAAHSPNGAVTTSATGRLLREGKPYALLLTVDPVDSLRQDGKDGWSANLVDRMGEMLRTADVACGIVTDGRWWSVVWADTREDTSRVSTIGSGIIDALNWGSDLLARDAYINLVSLKTLSGADESSRLDVLIADSLLDAEQITESLGTQVRGAVELLVQAFSESSRNAQKLGLPDPLPAETHNAYEAAVTVMMRVVFLLFAEERGLMPTGEMYRTAYSVAGLLDELEERRRYDGDESLERTEVWHRLLAASAALYEGASFDDVRMPAYGGSLFDPERFPWMEGSGQNGLAVRVTDRVMLEVLRSVQFAETGSGRSVTRQKLSFRDIDVEQIGYIYEGLLGYTCARVPEGEIVLGIVGKAGSEPEIALDNLEELYLAADGDDSALAKKLIEFWKKDQSGAVAKSPAQLAKILSDIDAAQNAEVDLKIRHLVEDDKLRQQIASWGNLIRRDLRGLPYVVPEGGLVVEETKSRANAGAHYTPRSLAEEVVLHTLQPLCYEPGPLQTDDSKIWKLKSSTEILNLRIVDIAVGSGAFLVAAARYLGERLLEAWQQESGVTKNRTDGDLNLAIREVVSQCLYGADINEMAVEMCKLSLWLVSLDPKKPFSFVDDKVLHGNSLLGLTDVKQLRGLHINPSATRLQNPGFTVEIERPLQKAADIRAKLATPIADQAELDPQRSAKHKKALLAESKAITAHLRKIADGIVAAGLKVGGKPGAALNAAYENLSLALLKAYPNVAADADPTMLEAIIRTGLTPTVETDYDRWKPLHWVVEVPDVIIGHGGFDAVIGNPPFLVDKKISPSIGDNARDYLIEQIAAGVRGKTDLVAFFLLRAFAVARPSGLLGLVTSKVVAEGSTKKVGLDQIAPERATIYRASKSSRWPSQGVSVYISKIWLVKQGLQSPIVTRLVDGIQCEHISNYLEVSAEHSAPPEKLQENTIMVETGTHFLGKGFLLDRQIAERMLLDDTRNADVLKPCLNGSELYDSPSQTGERWIIDFGEMTLEEASSYAEPFQRLEHLVLPERKKKNPEKEPRAFYEWWKHFRPRRALYDALERCSYAYAFTVTSRTCVPVPVSSGTVFTTALAIYTSDEPGLMTQLYSSPHWLWAVTHGSTMSQDPRYTLTDVGYTYPFVANSPEMNAKGLEISELMLEITARRSLGITDLFARVHTDLGDGDIDALALRNLIVEADRLVLAKMGLGDLPLRYSLTRYHGIERFSVDEDSRSGILESLLSENHRRAAMEAENGTVGKSSRLSRARMQLPGVQAQEKIF